MRADPVVWRGPVIAATVKQFWTDVVWGDVDFMFVDMPPGTGDVPLTVFQSLPVDGIIIVTSPQELVSMIVKKAMKMAQLMDVPVIGVVENMSYVECPDCGKKIMIYGESKTAQAAAEEGLPLLAQMPINPKLAALCDAGKIQDFEGDFLDKAVQMVEDFQNWDLEGDEGFLKQQAKQQSGGQPAAAFSKKGEGLLEGFGGCRCLPGAGDHRQAVPGKAHPAGDGHRHQPPD